jgi:hypothetical protein
MASSILQYVRDAGSCTSACKKSILQYFDTFPTYIAEETIVYRGQTVNRTIDPKTVESFFSVSTDMDVAADFATGGFLFKIHLQPGVQYISVGDVSDIYEFENEFLIRGGGVFTEIARHAGARYEIIEVTYKTKRAHSNKRNATNKANNKATNEGNNKRANNRNKTRNGNKVSKRRVSRKNLKERAIMEGVPENIINNNILDMYLNESEYLNNTN